jgi:hypothetical protein
MNSNINQSTDPTVYIHNGELVSLGFIDGKLGWKKIVDSNFSGTKHLSTNGEVGYTNGQLGWKESSSDRPVYFHNGEFVSLGFIDGKLGWKKLYT